MLKPLSKKEAASFCSVDRYSFSRDVLHIFFSYTYLKLLEIYERAKFSKDSIWGEAVYSIGTCGTAAEREDAYTDFVGVIIWNIQVRIARVATLERVSP